MSDEDRFLFKQYLASEIVSKTSCSLREAYEAVNDFSATPRFLDSCEKWIKTPLYKRKKDAGHHKGPRKISDIL